MAAIALLLTAVPAVAGVETLVPGVLPRDLDSAADLLVFVDGDKLWTIDVTDPVAPAVLGSVDTPGGVGAMGVKLDGSRAIVADGVGGLTLVDVSVPATPVVERTIPLEGQWAVDVDVHGSIAYVAAGLRFYVVDLFDGAPLPILGSHPVANEFIQSYEDVFVDPARPGQVVVLDHQTDIGTGRPTIQLLVFDVTNPAAPSPVGYRYAGEAVGDGPSLPVTLSLVDGLAVVGHTAYFGGAMLSVIDVSAPTQPVRRDFIALGTGSSQGVASAAPGGLFWASAGALRSVDLGDPDDVVVVDEAPFQLLGPMDLVGRTAFHGLSSLDFLDTGQFGPGAVGVGGGVLVGGAAWTVSPNPTRGGTTLRASRASGAWTTVDVLDVSGRRVASLGERWVGPGEHAFPWDGRDGEGRRLAAGVYYLSIVSGEERLVRRIVRIP